MDAKSIAENGLKRACSVFRQDLEALPEEAFAKSFGGAARTVADIVFEVNLVNDHAGMVIRREEPFPWPEGWIKAPPEFQTKDAAIAAFDRSSQRIIATAESLSSAGMESSIETEGGETSPFDRFRFLTLHLWYHSGQLNFIQTLLGDDAWHWN